MIERMVLQASSYAGSIDGLIMLILVLVGFWFILAEGMFFYLIWRFREKPGEKSEYITGKEKHIKRWVTVPHALVLVCDVFIIIGAIMTAFPIFFAVIVNDLRRVLAYSLNNQLGFMVVGIGIGTEMSLNGTAANAFSHILYKALLFMAIGAAHPSLFGMSGSNMDLIAMKT